MKQKILKALNYYGMLIGKAEITVALSGGADSMSLLYALNELKQDLGFKLYAAHFNHKIRGTEADRDEAFVRAICSELKIPLFCGSADVPQFAKQKHISLELAARELRYEFLKSTAKGLVATAHTADDNIETVLFNLARGSALKGLCGIPAKRDIYIRPLIFCSRADVEKYCEENGVEYVTDSTNLSDDYSRNKIRHNAVPVLREINSSLSETFGRTVLSLSLDNDYLEKTAKEEFLKRYDRESITLKGFDLIHKAIATRVLMMLFSNNISVPFDNFHIEELYRISQNGGKVSLPDNKSGVVLSGRLYIKSDNETEKPPEYMVELIESRNDLFENTKKVNELFLNNALDCDRIVGSLVIRTRKTGDSISIYRRKGTKTLKKLYTEHSVPLNERETLPVIADDEGVVWVCGIGVAGRCAVTEKSDKIIKINFKLV